MRIGRRDKTERPIRPRVTVDHALGALCLFGAAVSGALLIWDAPLGKGAASHQGPPLAQVSSSGGTVRCRPKGMLFWDSVGPGADLYSNDALFVPPGIEATVSFRNGSRLTLGESSLVVLDEGALGASANLLAGTAAGEGAADGIALSSGGAQVKLAKGDGVALTAKSGAVSVEAFSGNPLLVTSDGKSSALTVDEAATVADGGTERRRFALSLTRPTPDARIFFSDTPPPVELALKGTVPTPGWLQVSSDRSFSALVFEQQIASDVESRSLFSAPAAGTYYWRAVDAAGMPLSSTRRLTLVRDVPPRNILPAEGESLSGAGGRMLSFAWSGVEGAPAYKVEISGTPGFETVMAHAEVRRNGWHLAAPFEEGTYYWRVRTDDPGRGESPWSSPSRFLYTRRQLPNAPVLKDPTLEVEHAPPGN